MKKIRKDIEISDLIYKSLRGETSKSEDELLEAWCSWNFGRQTIFTRE